MRQRRKHKKSQGGQEKKKIQRGGALIERDVEINPRERLYELPYPFSVVCIILFEVLKCIFFHPVSQISPLREYSLRQRLSSSFSVHATEKCTHFCPLCFYCTGCTVPTRFLVFCKRSHGGTHLQAAFILFNCVTKRIKSVLFRVFGGWW